MTKKSKQTEAACSRRNFLKVGGAVAAGLQVGAVAGAGLAAGKDPSTHSGWQHLGDNTQFVDRNKLIRKGPAFHIVGDPRRTQRHESAFERQGIIMKNMRQYREMISSFDAGEERIEGRGNMEAPEPGKEKERKPPQGPMKYPPMDTFEEPMLSWYKERPDFYEADKVRMEEIMPKRAKDSETYKEYYTLINAWSGSWSTREPITEPPEVSDYKIGSGRKIGDPIPFKSPAHASKLIKKVAHHFGATMVGITTIEPDWHYDFGLRGAEDKGSYKIPEHWKYVIAIGIPHEWEQVNSNPNMATSFDAYSRSTIAARRLETYIKSLGYPARRHSPMDGYDLIGVPYLVKAGLGEQGRHGITITPETGANFRSAYITTNLEMEIDQPIDFGVEKFCEHCQICADLCPSGSISRAPNNHEMNHRGYRHWEINQTTCYNYWMQSLGGMGCRICLIACPYSRKANWLHTMARKADTADPTLTVAKSLTYLQKNLFDAPEAEDFLPPPDGEFANFREAPEWLDVQNYLDIEARPPSKDRKQ
jgi:reductive dehalogenase